MEREKGLLIKYKHKPTTNKTAKISAKNVYKIYKKKIYKKKRSLLITVR